MSCTLANVEASPMLFHLISFGAAVILNPGGGREPVRAVSAPLATLAIAAASNSDRSAVVWEAAPAIKRHPVPARPPRAQNEQTLRRLSAAKYTTQPRTRPYRTPGEALNSTPANVRSILLKALLASKSGVSNSNSRTQDFARTQIQPHPLNSSRSPEREVISVG